MISLGLLVDTKNANYVEVIGGESVENHEGYMLDVGSPEYEAKKNWIVKGEYEVIEEDNGSITLLVHQLDSDINVTLNKPAIVSTGDIPDINGEVLKNGIVGELVDIVPDDRKLDEYINTPVTAVVFHRKHLISSARDTKKKFVTAYADACIESYQKTNPLSTREDFAVIEIDWSNKHIELKSVAPLVDNSVDNEKEGNE